MDPSKPQQRLLSDLLNEQQEPFVLQEMIRGRRGCYDQCCSRKGAPDAVRTMAKGKANPSKSSPSRVMEAVRILDSKLQRKKASRSPRGSDHHVSTNTTSVRYLLELDHKANNSGGRRQLEKSTRDYSRLALYLPNNNHQQQMPTTTPSLQAKKQTTFLRHTNFLGFSSLNKNEASSQSQDKIANLNNLLQSIFKRLTTKKKKKKKKSALPLLSNNEVSVPRITGSDDERGSSLSTSRVIRICDIVRWGSLEEDQFYEIFSNLDDDGPLKCGCSGEKEEWESDSILNSDYLFTSGSNSTSLDDFDSYDCDNAYFQDFNTHLQHPLCNPDDQCLSSPCSSSPDNGVNQNSESDHNKNLVGEEYHQNTKSYETANSECVDEAEQNSPVSVLDSPFEDDVEQTQTQALVSFHRTKMQLLKRISEYEQVGHMDTDAVLVERRVKEREAESWSTGEHEEIMYPWASGCLLKEAESVENAVEADLKSEGRQWMRFKGETEDVCREIGGGIFQMLVEEVLVDLNYDII